jgi:hypothetical protein
VSRNAFPHQDLLGDPVLCRLIVSRRGLHASSDCWCRPSSGTASGVVHGSCLGLDIDVSAKAFLRQLSDASRCVYHTLGCSEGVLHTVGETSISWGLRQPRQRQRWCTYVCA